MNSLDRIGSPCILTDDIEQIKSAEKVIFPGVGEAKAAMDYLKAHNLDKMITSLTQPFLGICLGMQLMCSHSAERDTPCLSIFDTVVRKFPATKKVPHMGWSNFTEVKGDLFDGLTAESDMYFVHSYYAELCPYTAATCEYSSTFSASLHRDNFYGVQFHPEKSAAHGERLLRNFLELV